MPSSRGLKLLSFVFVSQVRTSYVPSEILWGYKFEHSCVRFNEKLGRLYKVHPLFTIQFWKIIHSFLCKMDILFPSLSINTGFLPGTYDVSFEQLNAIVPDTTPR